MPSATVTAKPEPLVPVLQMPGTSSAQEKLNGLRTERAALADVVVGGRAATDDFLRRAAAVDEPAQLGRIRQLDLDITKAIGELARMREADTEVVAARFQGLIRTQFARVLAAEEKLVVENEALIDLQQRFTDATGLPVNPLQCGQVTRANYEWRVDYAKREGLLD